MFSELTEAMIVNGVVLATVLATDLGSARKIGPLRMLRPVVAAAVIIPLFVDRPVTHGTGLVVEIAGVIAGLLGGLAAVALMDVYRSPETGRPVSRAGVPYALLWTVVIGARAGLLLRRGALVRGPAGQLGHRQPGQRRGTRRRADLHGAGHGAHAHRGTGLPLLAAARPGAGHTGCLITAGRQPQARRAAGPERLRRAGPAASARARPGPVAAG